MRKRTHQITYKEMEEYGNFFKTMRQSINYSLERMATELGIFRTTLSKWEKGLIIPQQDIYLLELKVRDVVKNEHKRKQCTI